MATSKLELAVGTGQWDAGLKKAQQALNSFIQSQGGLQQALGKDNEKMVQFVQMMGKMDSTANTAKGQLRDYRNSIEQLSAAFNSLSDAQKKGVEGQTITSALDSLKAKAMNAKQEVERLNVELGGVGKASGTFNHLLSGVAGKFGMSPQMFTGVGAAIAGIGTAAKLAGDNIRTAFNFERSISGLSALTGMVGKDLEKLKNNAIELGSTTTLTASQVADAFRLIGSQQPQLLSDADALKEVTKYAIRLSEAAGIDLATASQTLSTSINQMGGDSANAARYVNVLAAASQKGAGDISWLGEAITKAATAAKAVGTDYEELVANLEQLAKAGFDASTAGTALRSIIMNLEKQANSQFKPSVVGLTQAFENLGKAQLDITGYQNIAGKMFATQAKVLAEAAGAAKEMEKAITGTNIAEEQAQTNTANLDGSLKALASAWEGLNLHINDSNGFLKSCVDWLKETVQWMDNTFTAAGRAKKALDDLRGGGEDGKGRKIDTRTEYEVKEVKSAMQGEGDAAKVKQQQILDKYDRDIAAKQKELDRASAQAANAAKSGDYTYVATAQNIEERLRNEVEALKTLKQEFKSASDALITPKQAPQKTGVINNEEVEESQKSIKQLQDELKKLKQARDEAADAGNHELVEEYNADIKRIQAEIKAMRGGSTTNKKSATTKELSPLQQAQKEISALTEEALTADEARRKVIKDEIADLQKQVDEYKKIQDYVTGKGTAAQVSEAKVNRPLSVSDMIAQEREKMEAQQTALDSTTLSTLLRDSIKNNIDVGNLLDSANLEIQAGIDVPDETWQGILDKYNELREQIGEEPITIDFNTGKIAEDGKKANKTWKDAASAVQSVGSAFSQIEDPAAKAMGTVMQAIASIALGFAQAASAKDTTASGWAWLAWLAAGTAAMATTIATVHSLTGFAEGGIVPGNSFSGDNLHTVDYGINSGELILNRSQQSTIASALMEADNARGGYAGAPYVTGEKIVLGINNYARRSGRGELVFSK